jgi:diguanylate cyclase (GGDEF)-like protein/PAS domain S-box-containing protein
MARIVVVDGDADSRRLVCTLLRHRGHQAIEAADGAAGRTAVELEHPDLLISDLLMPVMDGFDLVRSLRTNPSFQHLKVIYYTAHFHERQARDLAAACGVRDMLFKPCDPEAILALVGEVLERGEACPVDATGSFDAAHVRVLAQELSREALALQTAKSRLAAVNYLGISLSAERDTRALLQHVCIGTRSLIGARYAFVLARDRYDADAEVYFGSGVPEGHDLQLPTPLLEQGPLGPALAERRSVRLANPGGDPARLGFPASYPRMHEVLAAPLVSPSHNYGWVCLAEKRGGEPFNDEDEHLLGMAAAQAGRIYESSTLYSELDRRAQSLEAQVLERVRATRELERSEKRFRQLAETIDEVFWIASPAYDKFNYISPAFERLWGRARSDAYSSAQAWMDGIHADDRARVLAAWRAQARGGAQVPLEFRVVQPGGAVRWVRADAYRMEPGSHGERMVAGVARDITELRRHEQEIERLSRMYALTSGINSMIVRIRDRDDLLGEACRLAVNEGRFAAAWGGFIDPLTLSGEVTTWHAEAGQAVRSMPLDRVARLPETAGTGAPFVLPDSSLALMAPLPDAPAPGGDSARIGVVPIIIEGQLVALLLLAAPDAAAFDANTLQLLAEMGGDIAYAFEHMAKEERLSYLAYHDPLTSLPNEQIYFDHLEQALRSAPAGAASVGVLLLDIDRFKDINDTLGRHIGDAVLRHVARSMLAALPASARLARINSDTFAVALDGMRHSEDLQRLAQALRAAAATPYLHNGQPVSVTLTAGMAVHPADGADAATLFKNGEAALVRAKSTASAMLFYSPDLNAQVAKRIGLESRLRRALERHEFVLHYQPKVESRTRRLAGFEALLRWNDPERGLIGPEEIIPVLEECGLIVAVGTEVMRMAQAEHRAWSARGLNPPRIAVNVSAMQLRQADFVEVVQGVVGEHGELADALELEITESILMLDLEQNIQKLRQLDELGVEISIDDFGTGYSSLRYLASLPAHTVKIDRSFVASMVADPDCMTIISTIISLAHSLKLDVCAEGIETEEQGRFLTLLRCDYMQGYHFGRPLPAELAGQMLMRGDRPLGGAATLVK